MLCWRRCVQTLGCWGAEDGNALVSNAKFGSRQQRGMREKMCVWQRCDIIHWKFSSLKYCKITVEDFWPRMKNWIFHFNFTAVIVKFPIASHSCLICYIQRKLSGKWFNIICLLHVGDLEERIKCFIYICSCLSKISHAHSYPNHNGSFKGRWEEKVLI